MMRAVLVAALAAILTSAAPAAPPNILLIITDDQGFGDVSLHGNDLLSTPNTDRIATEGARCERFFVEPVCAPTRAALLSGRFPTRTGVTGVTRGFENMRGEEITIAELLRDAGYATGCFGKWHNGAHWPSNPNGQGFNEFIGFCGGHWNNYYDPDLERNGQYFQARGFIADVFTNSALAFMEREHEAGEGPFFCYLPYNTPHTPASVSVEDWRRWAGRDDVPDVFTRAIYALCENIDANIGRLLSKLDELGIADETVVIFMTDNGPNGDRYNGDMLGRKGSEHEGGVRVPLFVRWPGRIAPGTVIEPNVGHVDLLPTLCSMAGVEIPAGHRRRLDGTDLSPLLTGDTSFELPERWFYTWRRPGKWSIRSARYRATSRTLHDLWEDPGQKTDLAAEKPELHRELIDRFLAWEKENAPAEPKPVLPHLGHDEWPRVTLKAHEFFVHPEPGRGINYCGGTQGYANQWIDQWTDANAYASCRLDVVAGGRYRVTLRQACPEDAVGAVFRLSVGETAVEIAINEPWVSEPRPAAEEYRKAVGYLSRDWSDVVAGEIELAPGEQEVRLEAVRLTGRAMPEVKAVIFEKR